MPSVTAWIIFFSLFGSIGSAIVAGALLYFTQGKITNIIPHIISYATGTLWGAAFLGMAPTALEQLPALNVTSTILFGMVVFFMLEKMLIWRNCHDTNCEVHSHAGTLLLIGDAFHNFVDGIVISITFLTSLPLGMAASLAIIAHEIPQEIGDLAILLENGYSSKKAFVLNILSASTTLIGAGIAYIGITGIQDVTPYILSISAASFIYIATADLTPYLHKRTEPRKSFFQFGLLLAGILTIALFHGH